MSKIIPRIGRLLQSNAFVLCCDVQERFIPLIHKKDSVVHVGKMLLSAAKILDLPVFATEQYAFGKTIPELSEQFTDTTKVYEKKQFSMLTDELMEDLTKTNRKQAILFGIEAHVCVLQTVLDLVERGYEVHIAADGTSSQRQFDRRVAFDRMMQSGAFISTAESILFQMMKTAEFEKFKDISKLCNAKYAGERPDAGEY